MFLTEQLLGQIECPTVKTVRGIQVHPRGVETTETIQGLHQLRIACRETALLNFECSVQDAFGVGVSSRRQMDIAQAAQRQCELHFIDRLMFFKRTHRLIEQPFGGRMFSESQHRFRQLTLRLGDQEMSHGMKASTNRRGLTQQRFR